MKDDNSRSTDKPIRNTGRGTTTSRLGAATMHPRIIAIARLIGRQIAREEYERRQAEAANDKPAATQGRRGLIEETGNHDTRCALRPLFLRQPTRLPPSRTSFGCAGEYAQKQGWRGRGTPTSIARCQETPCCGTVSWR